MLRADILNMGEPIPNRGKKFNTSLTDYSVQHKENTGPYAPNLEVDALIVGAGFGKSHTILCHRHAYVRL